VQVAGRSSHKHGTRPFRARFGSPSTGMSALCATRPAVPSPNARHRPKAVPAANRGRIKQGRRRRGGREPRLRTAVSYVRRLSGSQRTAGSQQPAPAQARASIKRQLATAIARSAARSLVAHAYADAKGVEAPSPALDLAPTPHARAAYIADQAVESAADESPQIRCTGASLISPLRCDGGYIVAGAMCEAIGCAPGPYLGSTRRGRSPSGFCPLRLRRQADSVTGGCAVQGGAGAGDVQGPLHEPGFGPGKTDASISLVRTAVVNSTHRPSPAPLGRSGRCSGVRLVSPRAERGPYARLPLGPPRWPRTEPKAPTRRCCPIARP
jgi:hypothetical protein